MVEVMRYNAYDRRRWKMTREILMPSTIGDSPGVIKTISAADRAASVLPCTAMPTFAYVFNNICQYSVLAE